MKPGEKETGGGDGGGGPYIQDSEKYEAQIQNSKSRNMKLKFKIQRNMMLKFKIQTYISGYSEFNNPQPYIVCIT